MKGTERSKVGSSVSVMRVEWIEVLDSVSGALYMLHPRVHHSLY
jgi:hypothetical protein